MFIHNEKSTQNLHIKERMLLEVSKSIEVAFELCDLFIEYEIGKWKYMQTSIPVLNLKAMML
jgi:hypothetical protein